MADERMSGVDRAWLLMERPTNPMMVVALVVFGAPLQYRNLKRIVAERFAAIARFRCRPVADYLGGSWACEADFRIEDHVLRAALPAPAGQSQLEDLVGQLASTPLDPLRPMWTFHLVERYQGGSALIVRIHHSYADGIALVHVFLSLTAESLANDAPVTEELGTAVSRDAAGDSGGAGPLATLDFLYEPVAGAVERAVHEGAVLAERALHLLMHPREALDTARTGADIAGELARIALQPDDPPTSLKGALGSVKRVAWAPPLPFQEVRALAKLLGCTINDVLMATLAGALGRYLEGRGEHVADLRIRAAVPVNLRTQEDPPTSLGNRFGLVFVELPIGVHDPLERLFATRAGMLELKGSRQPLVVLGLLAAIGSLPATVEEPALELFSRKASLVVSNVPGPRRPLALGGAPITQLLFWVPQAGSIGVGASILTYGDQVQFGILADRRLVPEPAALVAFVQPELERLLLLVLLGAAAYLPSVPNP
jgi:WS/DGAT/MGAT family acyltransferase